MVNNRATSSINHLSFSNFTIFLFYPKACWFWDTLTFRECVIHERVAYLFCSFFFGCVPPYLSHFFCQKRIPLLLDLKLKKVRAFRKSSRSDDGSTTAITKGVFIVVTAFITLVIVMSISNSLTLASVAFLLMVGLMVSRGTGILVLFILFDVQNLFL